MNDLRQLPIDAGSFMRTLAGDRNRGSRVTGVRNQEVRNQEVRNQGAGVGSQESGVSPLTQRGEQVLPARPLLFQRFAGARPLSERSAVAPPPTAGLGLRPSCGRVFPRLLPAVGSEV